MKMTKYELLKSNESLLRVMRKNGITTKSINYLDAYRELRLREADGEKTSYAVSMVARHHGISERQVYSLKSDFSKPINVD